MCYGFLVCLSRLTFVNRLGQASVDRADGLLDELMRSHLVSQWEHGRSLLCAALSGQRGCVAGRNGCGRAALCPSRRNPAEGPRAHPAAGSD